MSKRRWNSLETAVNKILSQVPKEPPIAPPQPSYKLYIDFGFYTRDDGQVIIYRKKTPLVISHPTITANDVQVAKSMLKKSSFDRHQMKINDELREYKKHITKPLILSNIVKVLVIPDRLPQLRSLTDEERYVLHVLSPPIQSSIILIARIPHGKAPGDSIEDAVCITTPIYPPQEIYFGVVPSALRAPKIKHVVIMWGYENGMQERLLACNKTKTSWFIERKQIICIYSVMRNSAVYKYSFNKIVCYNLTSSDKIVGYQNIPEAPKYRDSPEKMTMLYDSWLVSQNEKEERRSIQEKIDRSLF